MRRIKLTTKQEIRCYLFGAFLFSCFVGVWIVIGSIVLTLAKWLQGVVK